MFALVKPGGGTSTKSNRRNPHNVAAAVVAGLLTCYSPAPVSQQARRSPMQRPIYSDSDSDAEYDEWAGVANKLTVGAHTRSLQSST
jgi:hypothetical protein